MVRLLDWIYVFLTFCVWVDPERQPCENLL